MTDKVKFYEGTKSEIDSKSIENGSLYLSTDTKELLVDSKDERINLTGTDRFATKDEVVKAGEDPRLNTGNFLVNDTPTVESADMVFVKGSRETGYIDYGTMKDYELQELRAYEDGRVQFLKIDNPGGLGGSPESVTTSWSTNLSNVAAGTQKGMLNDISWDKIIKLKSGRYIVNQTATNNPSSGNYCNLFVLTEEPDDRPIAILISDSNAVYAMRGYSDHYAWTRLDSPSVMPISRGGTGATDAQNARKNLLLDTLETESGTGDTSFFVMLSAVRDGVLVRTAENVWNYIANKIRSTFGFNSSNILPIKNGGTGNNHGVLTTISHNPITTLANDTVANWMKINTGTYWFNLENVLHGQPTQYGYLLNIAGNGSNCINQFFLPPGSNRIYYRGTNGATNNNGAMGEFSRIRNITDTVGIVNGGTGATTAADARTNLGISTNTAITASNSDPIGYMTVGSAKLVSCIVPSFDLASQSVATKTVTFPIAFKTAPQVVAVLQSDSAAYSFGWCTVATLSRTTTSATLKFFNGDTTSSRVMCARVLAFGAA